MAKAADKERLKQATNIETAKGFLDNEKFLKFLDEFSGPDLDPANESDVKELEKRHETFERKGLVSQELTKLFKEHMKKELNVSLSDAELIEVDR